MVGLARRLLGEYAAADASAHGAEPHVEEEESHTVVYAIVIACLGVLFGTFLRWLETQIVPSLQDFKYLRLIGMPPYTLSVFFAGILTSGAHDALNNAHATYTGYKLVGGVEGGPPDHEKPFLITLAINAAQTVDAHVILLVLLPPLIYESAANMSWHVFSRISGQAFLLAFPGVVIQTYLVGAFFRYAMNYGGEADGGLWDWDLALCLGSIVSATDPVAVVAALHTLGAPEKLADIIDGEALLNDGSAMVMFLIFLENVRAKALGFAPHTFASGTAFFFQLSAGGFALGGLAFLVVITWLLFVENDWRVEIGVLLVGIYATFSLAEKFFHVSGVLAVVTLGLLMSRRGKYAFSPKATAVVEAATPLIAHVSETLIFYVAGIAAWTALYAHRADVHYSDAIVLFLVLQLVRGVAMGALYPLLSRMGYRINWREGTMMVYAGLRGAVSLALALLVLDEELIPALDRARIHFLVASMAILTMLVNGTTTPALYARLQIYPANAYRNVMVQRVLAELEGPTMEAIRTRLTARDKLYSRADWEVVKRLVPLLSGIHVLPSNRLALPDSVRTHVFDLELARRIAASEPAEAVALRAAIGSPPMTPLYGLHSPRAGGAEPARGGGGGGAPAGGEGGGGAPPAGLHMRRMRSQSEAGARQLQLTQHAQTTCLDGGGAGAHETLDLSRPARKMRRASTGAMADVKGAGFGGAGDERAQMVDPRKGWRAMMQYELDEQRRRNGSVGVGSLVNGRRASGVFESIAAAMRGNGGGGNGGGSGGGAPNGGGGAVRMQRERLHAAGSGRSLLPPLGSAGGPPAATTAGTGTTAAAADGGPAPAPAAGGAPAGGDAAMVGRLEQLAHRDRRFAPSGGDGAHAHAAHSPPLTPSHTPPHAAVAGGSIGLESLPDNFRASFELPRGAGRGSSYTRADKRDGIVETLFAVIRKLYSEQYERKQLAGGPLAVLIEALSSGEEYLSEYPHATAAAAFDLELDMVLWQLPAQPRWRSRIDAVPVVGPLLKSHLDFYRAFDRTEALAGFIRAHEELAHVLSNDRTRMQVVREAVAPALARAEAELAAHHFENWALVSFQINMLAARAAVLMKQEAVEHIAETGALTDADVQQLAPVFDRAVYLLDTVRFSLLAPFRYTRLLRAVERGQGGALPSVKVSPAATSPVANGRAAELPELAIVQESSLEAHGAPPRTETVGATAHPAAAAPMALASAPESGE